MGTRLLSSRRPVRCCTAVAAAALLVVLLQICMTAAASTHTGTWQMGDQDPEKGVQEVQLEIQRIIAESTPTRKQLLLVDTSKPQHITPNGNPELYYLDRDGPAWRRAFGLLNFTIREEHAGMENKARHKGTVGWSHLFCLGLRRQQDMCLPPGSHFFMTQQQRINQISGMRSILWKKDALCETIKMYGLPPHAMDFVFPCFVLPDDMEALRTAMHVSPAMPWIVKPRARGEGRGIFIADSAQEIESSASRDFMSQGAIVQPLLRNPLLINGYKFDLRLYVLVTSISPLNCYIFNEGLVRFAAEKYTGDSRNSKPSQFLTNTSVGKRYRDLKDLTWTLTRLKTWLNRNTTVGAHRVFESINSAIVRLLLMAEPRFHAHFHEQLNDAPCKGCFQLLGVDVILDREFTPHIIEINGLPSMQLTAEQGTVMSLEDDYTARKIALTTEVAAIVSATPDVTQSVHTFMQQNGIGIAPTLCSTDAHTMCIDKDDLALLVQWFQHHSHMRGFQRLQPESEPGFLQRSHALVLGLPHHIHTQGGLLYTSPRTTLRLAPLMAAFERWRRQQERRT